LTPQEITDYQPHHIFLNKTKGLTYTKMSLKQLFSRAKTIQLKNIEKYKADICRPLIPIKMFHLIGGKNHSNQCRYAKGDNPCECWCQGKYHGLGDVLDD